VADTKGNAATQLIATSLVTAASLLAIECTLVAPYE
jgi:hypothetical protein